MTSSTQPVLSVLVSDETELSAVEEIVYYLYTGRLKASSVPALLTVRQCALYMGAPHAVADCDVALACLELCVKDAVTVYRAISDLKVEHQPSVMQPLTERLRKALLSDLGCAYTTLTTPQLLCSVWRQLPWQAVEALLSSDELRADSEVGRWGGDCCCGCAGRSYCL